VFLTGLSGAGRSTIADALVADLEADGRPVTLLDGEVVKHGGTVVVAAIAPYESAREEAGSWSRSRAGSCSCTCPRRSPCARNAT
jgi:adenylylsulfate kinase-like enzyme